MNWSWGDWKQEDEFGESFPEGRNESLGCFEVVRRGEMTTLEAVRKNKN